MKKIEALHIEWLIRAKSNLEKAKIDISEKSILYEDFCFDCQQTVEKSLKAFLVYHNIQFPKTHSINTLIALLSDKEKEIPSFVIDSIYLSDYFVETRYPGDYEPVNKEE